MNETIKNALLTAILICLSIIAFRLGDKNGTDKQILSNVRDLNMSAKMYQEWVRDVSDPKTFVEMPKLSGEAAFK